jgi:hypothetical protein
MANNCWNTVSFYGKPSEIKELTKRLITYSSFDYVNSWGDYVCKITDKDLPYNREDDKRPYYFYGTKWWDFEIVNEDADSIQINGDSAWGPPLGLIQSICETYEMKAEIEYDEPGMDFAGRAEFDENGIVSHEEMTSNEYRYRDDKSYWVQDLAYCDEGRDTDTHSIKQLKKDHPYAAEEDILDLIKAIKEFNN